MTSVTIIEDNAIVRDTLKEHIFSLNGFRLLGAYESFEDAYSEIKRDVPDIVLMDIKLPGKDGIEATGILKNRYSKISIIIITIYENSKHLFLALKNGAQGYLTKNINKDQLERALLQVKNGGAPMSNHIAMMVVNSFHKNTDNPLSFREQEILQLISKGKTYSSIASDLFLSKNTVRTHIRNIYEKLHVHSKEEALKKANENNLI